MKKIIFLVMLGLSIFTAKAQWSLSPEVGITAVNRAGMSNEKWDAKWKLGVGVEYQLTPLFSLKSGLHLTQRGYKNNMAVPYITEPYPDGEQGWYMINAKSKRNFLQIPLMLQIGLDLGKGVRLNAAAGVYAAYSIYHSSSYGAFNYSGYNNGYGGYGYGQYSNYGYGNPIYELPWDPLGGLRSFDWGTTFSVGLETNRMYFNVGYDLSLGKEYKHSSIGANYHTLSLTVGYKFKL